MPFTFEFRVMRNKPGPNDDPEGDFRLFGKGPDHYTPMKTINDWVGKEVLCMMGSGMGVNLKIVDMDAWSDYCSNHVSNVDDNSKHCVFTMPDHPPVKRI